MAQDAHTHLVLASQSPRRVELLRFLGLTFDVIPSFIDESTELRDPAQVVEFLAEQKAQAVTLHEKVKAMTSTTCVNKLLVLGADTIVVLGKDILGKPTSREDAYQMLVRMSGRCHKVYTGVALVDCIDKTITVAHEVSSVYFRSLDSAEIRAYARTEEPLDKAGSYALQGTASAFVERVEGCYTNIIGLPIPLTVKMLRGVGVRILGLP